MGTASPIIKIQTVFEKTGPKALHRTIKIIGQSIVKGSTFPPLRANAAGLATRANPKDYIGQAKAIFDDFTTRWRYVHDPLLTELVSGDGNSSWNIVYGAGARRGEKGHGDCDDATAALGAALLSVGFPVRIATVNKPGSPTLFTHVYPEFYQKGIGWIAADAVGFPKHGIGWNPPADRYAVWDLNGKLISKRGKFPASFQQMLNGENDIFADYNGGIAMTERDQIFRDQGLERYGFAGVENDGQGIADWSNIGLVGFGAYEPTMGMMEDASHLMAEYDETDTIGNTDFVRTKMFEMDPDEYRYMQQNGRPRQGAVALGDDGDVYQWREDYEGLGGFFKKMFKRIGSRVKKVFKKIGSVARKILKKIPGGKYLIKLHDKVKAITMKIVKPLMKFVGRYAAKLAPLAAMIPGYGPAIAAGLKVAGKISKVLSETGVLQDKKGKLIFKSGAQAKQLQKALHREAKALALSKGMKPKPTNKGRRSVRLLKAGTPEHVAALRGLGALVEA